MPSIASNLSFLESSTGTVSITNSINASSTTTGALLVTGGAGIGGNLYVGGQVFASGGLVGAGSASSTGTTSTFFINNSTPSTSTTTGALQVTGGVGIGGALYVGSGISGNLLGGSAGAIVYQSATSTTSFLSVGSNGQILGVVSGAPAWITTGTLAAGSASTATNIAGGTAGQIPYQTAAGATSFFGAGAVGTVLTGAGTSAPVFTASPSLNALNISTYANLAITTYTQGNAYQLTYVNGALIHNPFHNMWSDKLRYNYPIQTEISVDGINYVTTTTDTITRSPFSGNVFNHTTNVNLDGSNLTSVRYTGNNLIFSSGAWIALATKFDSTASGMTVRWETSATSTASMTTLYASTVSSVGNSWTWIPTNEASATWNRFTISRNTSTGYTGTVRLVTMQWWTARPADQGSGFDSMMPIAWDNDRNITISTSTTATAYNSAALVVPGGVGIARNLIVQGTIVGGGVRATTSASPPANPIVGDIWYSSNDDVVYRQELDGAGNTIWVDITSPTVGNVNFGFQGVQGVQGPQGPQGNQGTQGIQGSTGTQGLQGNQGLQVQGIQGPQGAQGTQAAQGIQGIGGTSSFTGGTVANPINITATVSATSTTTGSLTVIGGVGIGGNLYVGGQVFVSGGLVGAGGASSTGTTSSFYISGTGSNLIVDGFVKSPYPYIGPSGIQYIQPSSNINLTAINTGTAGTSTQYIVVTPNGRFLYGSSTNANGFLYGFNIDQTTGYINPITTGSQASNIAGLAIHPNGRFLYAGAVNGTSVVPYSINSYTGALTYIGTSYSGVSQRLIIDPTGRYMYGISNGASPNTIQLYYINQTNGTLVLGPSIVSSGSGGYSHNLVIDPLGRYAYVTSGPTFGGGPWIGHYQIGSTGTLSLVSTATTVDVNSFAGVVGIDSSGRFLYASNTYGIGNSTNTIYTFVINQSTGALTTSSSVLAPSGEGFYAWLDPIRNNIFIINGSGVSTLGVYSINPANGDLSTATSITIASQQTGGNWAFDPRGRFAFQSQYQSNYVQSYAINNFAAGAATFAGPIVASSTVVSTGTNTGALVVGLGGAGIGGSLTVGNKLYIGSGLNAQTNGLAFDTNGIYRNGAGIILSGGAGVGTSPSTAGASGLVAGNNGPLDLYGGGVGNINLNAGLTYGVVVFSTLTSTSTTTGAIVVSNVGGIGVGGSVYVGNRVGFVDKTNVSRVFQVYNTVTNSLDTVFG
jgi:6-phosphogluconolactonase (cycloisomerase 2 family)